MKPGLLETAEIYSANDDLSQEWFVSYYAVNPSTGKRERQRWYKGINRIKDLEGRKAKCLEIKLKIEHLLNVEGWNPYTGTRSPIVSTENDSIIPVIPGAVIISLEAAINLYIDYLNNVGVTFFEHNQRTENHVKDVNQMLLFIGTTIPLSIPVNEFTKNKAGDVYRNLCNKIGKNGKRISVRTHNKYVSTFKSFFTFLKSKGHPVHNHFETIILRKIRKRVKMITLPEYHGVLEKLQTGFHYKKCSYRKKNGAVLIFNRCMNKPWLKSAFELALIGGGRRREEVITLKWTQVIDNYGDLLGGIIRYYDLKVQRQQTIQFEDEILPVEVPITPQLKELLLRLGWEKNKGKNIYVIAPEYTGSRRTLMDLMTNSFTHYYQQLTFARPGVSFRNLRKTYISYIRSILGRNGKEFSGHSTEAIIDNHYEDTTLMREKLIKELNF